MGDYSDDGSEVECDECHISIHCAKEGVFILTKGEEELTWCQSCFEDMWEDAAKDGWGGDDIEVVLSNLAFFTPKKSRRSRKPPTH